jgi:hypothetical protein
MREISESSRYGLFIPRVGCWLHSPTPL